MRYAAYFYSKTLAGNFLGTPEQLDIDAKALHNLGGIKGNVVLKEARIAAWWGVALTNQTFELRVTAFLRGNDLPISQNLLASVPGLGTVVSWNRIVFTDRVPFINYDQNFILPDQFIVDMNFQPLFAIPVSANGDVINCFVNLGYDIIK